MAAKRSSSGSSKSRARRAASKAKSSSSSSKSSSSSSKSSSSSSKSSSSSSKSSSSSSKSSSSSSSTASRAAQIAEISKKAAELQKAVDKKVAEQKAAAASTSSKTGTTSSSKSGGSSSSAPTVNYTYDSRKETTAQYNARIEKERQAVRDYTVKKEVVPVEEETEDTTTEDTTTGGTYDDSAVRNSAQFKGLTSDQQSAVLAVFEAIANNDTEKASKISAAFKAAADISNPFFKQELRMAVDAIERGFVSIDKEEEFKRKQLQTNLADLEQDITTQKEYLTLEQQAALRGIERQYSQDLESTRQNLAATGKTSSSERIRTEDILAESTGELRESTQRRFGLEKTDLELRGQRGARDTQAELARLAEVTKMNRIDFLRSGEAKVGSKNLPRLNTNLNTLGGITGDIEQRQTADIISGASNLLF